MAITAAHTDEQYETSLNAQSQLSQLQRVSSSTFSSIRLARSLCGGQDFVEDAVGHDRHIDLLRPQLEPQVNPLLCVLRKKKSSKY